MHMDDIHLFALKYAGQPHGLDKGKLAVLCFWVQEIDLAYRLPARYQVIGRTGLANKYAPHLILRTNSL